MIEVDENLVKFTKLATHRFFRQVVDFKVWLNFSRKKEKIKKFFSLNISSFFYKS
jgi:hypothetical protein